MNVPKKVNINNQQIAQAAGNIWKLLNDDDRVNLPPSMARSGDLVIMDAILSGLASGQFICVPPDQVKEEFIQPAPGANGAEAGEGASAEE